MSFEKLHVWKRSAKLCTAIYKQFAELKDYGFRDQITRSSLSISSNIAEGMDRESNKEKKRFLVFSRGSTAELRSQIYIGIDIKYIPKKIGDIWIQETREISAMLVGLIKTLED